jgi:hypothetical protein
VVGGEDDDARDNEEDDHLRYSYYDE